MAILNKVDCKGKLVLEGGEPDFVKSTAEAADHPLAVANHAVNAAGKIPLAAGTRVCMCTMVEGAVYAISGVDGDDNIAVGEGFYIPPNNFVPVPVGRDAQGALHTHLLVINAA